jgi:hypothetical protein
VRGAIILACLVYIILDVVGDWRTAEKLCSIAIGDVPHKEDGHTTKPKVDLTADE